MAIGTQHRACSTSEAVTYAGIAVGPTVGHLSRYRERFSKHTPGRGFQRGLGAWSQKDARLSREESPDLIVREQQARKRCFRFQVGSYTTDRPGCIPTNVQTRS
ncbi:uncharacterized protein LOC143264015 isoform X2 [Megachile rotundata]|uniref:uncharacterized protein LOC143264015 isoform X2 n=1 Tax=Megachile rotundata TaxID=143995 RepID=UPI003FD28639